MIRPWGVPAISGLSTRGDTSWPTTSAHTKDGEAAEVPSNAKSVTTCCPNSSMNAALAASRPVDDVVTTGCNQCNEERCQLVTRRAVSMSQKRFALVVHVNNVSPDEPMWSPLAWLRLVLPSGVSSHKQSRSGFIRRYPYRFRFVVVFLARLGYSKLNHVVPEVGMKHLLQIISVLARPGGGVDKAERIIGWLWM